MAEVIGDVDELVKVISRTAEQSALNVEAEAQRSAQQILAQARDEADAAREAMLNQAHKEAAETQRRIHAQGALAAQQQRLLAREALFDAVWAEAEQRLRALTDQPVYVDVLRRLAFAAARLLGDGLITLTADAKGHALLDPDLLAAWSAAAQATFVRAAAPGNYWGGLLATHADGRRQVDATWATRLDLARELLREQVAATLEVA